MIVIGFPSRPFLTTSAARGPHKVSCTTVLMLSQFFIAPGETSRLDVQRAVFGEVTKRTNVVEKIRSIETTAGNALGNVTTASCGTV